MTWRSSTSRSAVDKLQDAEHRPSISLLPASILHALTCCSGLFTFHSFHTSFFANSVTLGTSPSTSKSNPSFNFICTDSASCSEADNSSAVTFEYS